MIAVNGWNESRQVVKRFVDKENLKQHVLLMGGQVAATKFGVRSYPTSFWIDKKGNVLKREVGFNPAGVAAMEKRIEELLARK